MTIRQDLTAKLAEIDAKWQAEKAPIEAELAAGGAWLEQEWHDFEAWVAGLMAKKP